MGSKGGELTMFPNNHLNDTIVYWGSPTNDGYGSFTYAEPIEITGRWVNGTELVTSTDGKEIVSTAQVQVDRDLEEDGYLYLGSLESYMDDPKDLDGAYVIKKVMKTPTVKHDAYYREVYL